MAEDIFNPAYWSKRFDAAVARERIHHALWEVDGDVWKAERERHRNVLSATLRPDDSILDAGCGWGRLLGLLPSWWRGEYLGVDLCSEFVALARRNHPDRRFEACDLRDPLLSKLRADANWRKFDFAIAIGVEKMVIKNAGAEAWEGIKSNLLACADRLLTLDVEE